MSTQRSIPKARATSGQGLVELALALPVLLLILLGTVDLGRMFFDYIEMRNAAREAAGWVSRHPDPDGLSEARDKAVEHGLPTGALITVKCIPTPTELNPKNGCEEAGGRADAYVEITSTFTPVATGFLQTYFGIDPIQLRAEASMRVLV